MSLRIAFVSQYFYPEQFSNNDIAKWLVERGHKVDVVCCVPNYPKGQFFDGYSNSRKRNETWNGMKIHRARTWPRGSRKISLLMNFLTFPITASVTAWRKLGGNFDVIFVSMPSPLLQALAGIFLKVVYRKPLVYWVQDIWPESAILTLNLKNKIINKTLRAICGWIYRRADILLVQSQAFPAMISRFGIADEKIRVFPNTAPEMNLDSDGDALAEFQITNQPAGFRILFAGNIGESQDFDTYIETAQILQDKGRNVDWFIVGSGRDQSRVEQKIAQLKLDKKFHFLGRFPESHMPKFFAAADALLVGLKDNPIFRLTLPYKVQCYLASGKPIIGSLSGEGARIVSEARAGQTAEAESPHKLAEAVEKMMGMSVDERAALGQNGRMYFEKNYSKEVVYSILETALNDAVKN